MFKVGSVVFVPNRICNLHVGAQFSTSCLPEQTFKEYVELGLAPEEVYIDHDHDPDRDSHPGRKQFRTHVNPEDVMRYHRHTIMDEWIGHQPMSVIEAMTPADWEKKEADFDTIVANYSFPFTVAKRNKWRVKMEKFQDFLTQIVEANAKAECKHGRSPFSHVEHATHVKFGDYWDYFRHHVTFECGNIVCFAGLEVTSIPRGTVSAESTATHKVDSTGKMDVDLVTTMAELDPLLQAAKGGSLSIQTIEPQIHYMFIAQHTIRDASIRETTAASVVATDPITAMQNLINRVHKFQNVGSTILHEVEEIKEIIDAITVVSKGHLYTRRSSSLDRHTQQAMVEMEEYEEMLMEEAANSDDSDYDDCTTTTRREEIAMKKMEAMKEIEDDRDRGVDQVQWRQLKIVSVAQWNQWADELQSYVDYRSDPHNHHHIATGSKMSVPYHEVDEKAEGKRRSFDYSSAYIQKLYNDLMSSCAISYSFDANQLVIHWMYGAICCNESGDVHSPKHDDWYPLQSAKELMHLKSEEFDGVDLQIEQQSLVLDPPHHLDSEDFLCGKPSRGVVLACSK